MMWVRIPVEMTNMMWAVLTVMGWVLSLTFKPIFRPSTESKICLFGPRVYKSDLKNWLLKHCCVWPYQPSIWDFTYFTVYHPLKWVNLTTIPTDACLFTGPSHAACTSTPSSGSWLGWAASAASWSALSSSSSMLASRCFLMLMMVLFNLNHGLLCFKLSRKLNVGCWCWCCGIESFKVVQGF